MRELYREVWRRRELIHQLVRGQQQASIHGMRLGSLWFTLVPLVQIAIYYFLIMVIFSSGAQSASSFMIITMGIMHYALLINVGSYTKPAIHTQASLLLQVKLEPFVLIAAGFVRTLILSRTGIVLFFLCYAFTLETVSLRLLAYPFILLAWIMLSWLIGIAMATMAVYVRDLERLFPILLQILMYASPVLYAANMFPASYQTILLLNPIASMFALFQWSLFDAPVALMQPILVIFFWLVVGTWGAHRFYLRMRPHFTKVL